MPWSSDSWLIYVSQFHSWTFSRPEQVIRVKGMEGGGSALESDKIRVGDTIVEVPMRYTLQVYLDHKKQPPHLRLP